MLERLLELEGSLVREHEAAEDNQPEHEDVPADAERVVRLEGEGPAGPQSLTLVLLLSPIHGLKQVLGHGPALRCMTRLVRVCCPRAISRRAGKGKVETPAGNVLRFGRRRRL